LQSIREELRIINGTLSEPEVLPAPVSAAFPVIRPVPAGEGLPSPLSKQPAQGGDRPERTHGGSGSIVVKIPKLADQIIVREEGDMERISESVARRIIEAMKNMPRLA